MPRRVCLDPLWPALLRDQDMVVHRDQALDKGYTRRAIDRRLAVRAWQVLLPDVYLCHPGDPARRQRLVAAQLYAGSHSAIDAADACRFHGITAVAVDDVVHIVEPWGAPTRSIGFVVIRRTVAPIRVVATDRLRYVDAATAVIAATRRMRADRAVLAALSDAVQRGVASYEELVRAHVEGPPRNARRADAALEAIGSGARSAPEVDFLALARASTILPEPELNVMLRLPAGRTICVDALIRSSALVHETNGRAAHRRADLFEDMQERHDALSAAGFVVLHNSPRRLRLRGREAIAEVERCHQRYAGRGLPPDVAVVPARAAWPP